MADWGGSYWYPGSSVFEYWKRYLEDQRRLFAAQPIKHGHERLEEQIQQMEQQRDALGSKIRDLTGEYNELNENIIAMVQFQRLTSE